MVLIKRGIFIYIFLLIHSQSRIHVHILYYTLFFFSFFDQTCDLRQNSRGLKYYFLTLFNARGKGARTVGSATTVTQWQPYRLLLLLIARIASWISRVVKVSMEVNSSFWIYFLTQATLPLACISAIPVGTSLFFLWFCFLIFNFLSNSFESIFGSML